YDAASPLCQSLGDFLFRLLPQTLSRRLMSLRIFDPRRSHIRLDNPEQRRGVFSEPRRHRIGFKLSAVPEFMEELIETFEKASPHQRATEGLSQVMVLGKEGAHLGLFPGRGPQGHEPVADASIGKSPNASDQASQQVRRMPLHPSREEAFQHDIGACLRRCYVLYSPQYVLTPHGCLEALHMRMQRLVRK